MLGPLPRLYRSLTVVAILILGVAAGAWVAHMTALPVAASVGAWLGAGAAALLAYAVVHDFHPDLHRDLHPRTVRAGRRR